LVSGLDEGKYSKYLNTNLREGYNSLVKYKYQYGTDKGNVIVNTGSGNSDRDGDGILIV
jgi:hypothetical protein